MTRSYNSRRGHYGCKACRRWDFLQYENYRRGKQNRKRVVIKFEGTLYTQKRKHSIRKKGYWSSRNVYNEKWEIIGKKLVFEKYRKVYWPENDWHYKYIQPAKDSYMNWTWLSGKPNKKGYYHRHGRYRLW